MHQETSGSVAALNDTAPLSGKLDDVLEIPYCCCINFWCCERAYYDLYVNRFNTKSIIPWYFCSYIV